MANEINTGLVFVTKDKQRFTIKPARTKSGDIITPTRGVYSYPRPGEYYLSDSMNVIYTGEKHISRKYHILEPVGSGGSEGNDGA